MSRATKRDIDRYNKFLSGLSDEQMTLDEEINIAIAIMKNKCKAHENKTVSAGRLMRSV